MKRELTVLLTAATVGVALATAVAGADNEPPCPKHECPPTTTDTTTTPTETVPTETTPTTPPGTPTPIGPEPGVGAPPPELGTGENPNEQKVTKIGAATPSTPASSESLDELPFTGVDLLWIATAGLTLVLAGLGVRTIGRD